MSARGVAAALALALASAPRGGWAQRYRHPLGGCHTTCATVSAYYDLDASGGIRDWTCGRNTYNGHRGTDIAIYGTFSAQDAGRDVVAAAPGTVTVAHDGEFDRCTSGACAGGGGFGNHVAVRHADGKVTYYGHLRRGSVRVRAGQSVACGEHLGQVGSSGYSTGPHLHFEVRVGGTTADDPFAASAGCGGPESYWVSQGGYRALPAETCESAPPPPPPVPCLARNGPFAWNCGGAVDGMRCVNVDEPADPHTWGDNHVCTAEDLGLRWSNAGPVEGMACTRVEEPSEPAAHAWADNHLCLPAGSAWRLRWSYAGAVAGMDCVRWLEPADPHAWEDNFLCWSRVELRDDAAVAGQTPSSPLRVRAGEAVLQRFALRNTGTTVWTAAAGYRWALLDGGGLDAPATSALRDDARVLPGDVTEVQATVRAPSAPGRYRARWQMERAGAARFGAEAVVEIEIAQETSPDAGTDAGTGRDAGSVRDAGAARDAGRATPDAGRATPDAGGDALVEEPTVEGGCACRAGAPERARGGWLALAALGVIGARRRWRRGARRSSSPAPARASPPR